VGRFEQNVSEVACRYFPKSGDLSEYCKRELGLSSKPASPSVDNEAISTILSFTTTIPPSPLFVTTWTWFLFLLHSQFDTYCSESIDSYP